MYLIDVFFVDPPKTLCLKFSVGQSATVDNIGERKLLSEESL